MWYVIPSGTHDLCTLLWVLTALCHTFCNVLSHPPCIQHGGWLETLQIIHPDLPTTTALWSFIRICQPQLPSDHSSTSANHNCPLIIHPHLPTTTALWSFIHIYQPQLPYDHSPRSANHNCPLIIHPYLPTTTALWSFISICQPHLPSDHSSVSANHNCPLIIHPYLPTKTALLSFIRICQPQLASLVCHMFYFHGVFHPIVTFAPCCEYWQQCAIHSVAAIGYNTTVMAGVWYYLWDPMGSVVYIVRCTGSTRTSW